MASVVYTPRKDGKTATQGRADMKRLLDTYYIGDEGEDLDRGNRAVPPPSAPVSPKTKKPAARKRNAPTPQSMSSTSSQESPSTRKSARIAAGAKRTAKAIDSDDAASEHSSPTKKQKTRAISPLKATGASKKKVEPATIQKHTGRFTPINAQLKRAEKIEKRPVDFDDSDSVDKPKPAKRAKKTHVVSEITAAAAGSDMIEMGIEDANDAAEAEDTPAKGKGKAKKAAPPVFVGTTDQMGSSIQKPDDAPNNTHWKCANRNCNSGQTWHDRDGQDSYGRKVISNFFGRNKKETNLIHPDVWHNYCRKDYQRQTYRANTNSPQAKCNFYIDNIDMQLERIHIWRSEAKFKVQLSKGASTRLGEYYKELNKNGGDEPKAKLHVTKTAKTNAKGQDKPLSLEDALPIKKLKEFDDRFCASNLDFGDLDIILQWIRDQVKNGSITSMPPMEFLINAEADDEETTDPTTNYDRWTAREDRRDFVEPGTADAEEADGDDDETDSNAAGPSATQNTVGETEVEANDAGDATAEQTIDEGDIPDFESYVAETPLEDRFPTQDTQDAEDGGDEYASDSEGDETGSEDEDDEPTTPPPLPKSRPLKWHLTEFGRKSTSPLATTIGLINNRGEVIRPVKEIRADWNRIRAHEATSPITSADPNPFKMSEALKEAEQKEVVGEEGKAADAGAGAESSV